MSVNREKLKRITALNAIKVRMYQIYLQKVFFPLSKHNQNNFFPPKLFAQHNTMNENDLWKI